MSHTDAEGAILAAARALQSAKALVFAAGAGMGVDSGLPDFRGPEGFWRAYPAYKKLGLDFMALANPRWFRDDPSLAWGFYGHRLNLYRSTVPHEGFSVLRRLAERAEGGAFVFTSNVDGQFQRAGFHDDQIAEAHGAIGYLQCTSRCPGITEATGVRVEVDPETFRAVGELPRCATCGALARPNILMFGDFGWDPSRTAAQEERLTRFLDRHEPAHMVVIELGAGTAVPTVRRFSERLLLRGASLVRINVREPEGPLGTLGVALGAKEALTRIEAALGGASSSK